MNKLKKIPMRKCIVTNEKLPKKQLIRIVINKEKEVFVDLCQKAGGAGVYIKPEVALAIKAQKNAF